MKKISKKILAFAICLAMVVSALASFTAKVDAATLTQDELNSIAGTGPMQNMVLNKSATLYPGCAEGSPENLSNGSISNGHCAISSGWGYSGDAYAIFDLGKYYVASSLDKLVLAYKDNADNDTVVGRTYNIQYSIDGLDWRTVYTSSTISAADVAGSNATVDAISSFTGNVRYVKVDYPSLPTYGIQLTEIAVLATNPVEATIETCDNADAVVASSAGIGKISFSITPGVNQEDYTYEARLDSSDGSLLRMDCLGNTLYTVDAPSGNHTVFVISHYNGLVSSGIQSNQVSIDSYESLVANSTYNYAYNKEFTRSSGATTEGGGSITNGTIASNDYSTSDKGTAGSWQCIDLGELWKCKSFETLVVWFRSSVPGTFPENGGMKYQYSVNGTDWTDEATLSQAEFNQQVSSTAPFPVKADVSSASGNVRYIRVYFPNAVAYGGQITEFGIYDIDGDAERAAEETVTNPAAFTATSNSYNKITGTITPDAGQQDYKYNVYLNGNIALSGVDGGSYTISHVEAGTYTVTCKSIHNNQTSSGISAGDVTVSNGFVYTSTTGEGTYPDSNTNGYNYVTQYGGTLLGVSATASSQTGTAGADGPPQNAIDYNVGTRWESQSSDPQWIVVDLGAIKPIKEICALWETANSKDFTISLSSNGTDFNEVAYVENASAGNNRSDSIVLTDTTNGRYVKINGTSRTTGYGHSIREIAVYGPTAPPAQRTITIDGTVVETMTEGSMYTLPTSGMTEYTENGYYLNSDPSKAYAPGDQIEVNGNLSFTAIDYLSVVNGNGASIRMDKSNPGLSFKVTYDLNHSDPVMSSAFTYGALITTIDAYFDKYNENLIIDNSGDQANVIVKTQSDWYSYEDGIIRPGIMKIRPYNITRDFVCRGYVKINYVSGQSKIIYATNPDGEGRVRSVTQVAISVKNTPSYYNTLSASEKEAVDYFAEQ